MLLKRQNLSGIILLCCDKLNLITRDWKYMWIASEIRHYICECCYLYKQEGYFRNWILFWGQVDTKKVVFIYKFHNLNRKQSTYIQDIDASFN